MFLKPVMQIPNGRRIVHFQPHSLLLHFCASAEQEFETSRYDACFANTQAFGKSIANDIKHTIFQDYFM